MERATYLVDVIVDQFIGDGGERRWFDGPLIEPMQLDQQLAPLGMTLSQAFGHQRTRQVSLFEAIEQAGQRLLVLGELVLDGLALARHGRVLSVQRLGQFIGQWTQIVAGENIAENFVKHSLMQDPCTDVLTPTAFTMRPFTARTVVRVPLCTTCAGRRRMPVHRVFLARHCSTKHFTRQQAGTASSTRFNHRLGILSLHFLCACRDALLFFHKPLALNKSRHKIQVTLPTVIEIASINPVGEERCIAIQAAKQTGCLMNG